MQELNLDYFVTSTIKLRNNFPTCQFHNSIYEVTSRRDRSKYGQVEI